MTFDERLAALRAGMIEHALDLIVAVHNGAHFIETPNPVFVLSGFKSLGPAAVVLPRDGEASLIVTQTVIAAGCEDAIESGGVYSLRAGLSDPRGHTIVSAMVAVHAQGNEVLWSSPEPSR